MGNILIAFQLATTKKEDIEEVLQKNLQELASLKRQLLQLQNTIDKMPLPYNIYKWRCKT
jgi:hypothetical protein